jgi:hypothetical protein
MDGTLIIYRINPPKVGLVFVAKLKIGQKTEKPLKKALLTVRYSYPLIRRECFGLS